MQCYLKKGAIFLYNENHIKRQADTRMPFFSSVPVFRSTLYNVTVVQVGFQHSCPLYF